MENSYLEKDWGARIIVFIAMNEMVDGWIRDSDFSGWCNIIAKYFSEDFLEFAEQALKFLLENKLAAISNYDEPPWPLSIDESMERALKFLKMPVSSEFGDERFRLRITPKGNEVVSELNEVFLKV